MNTMKASAVKTSVEGRLSRSLQDLSKDVIAEDIRIASVVLNSDTQRITRYLKGSVAMVKFGNRLHDLLKQLVIAREQGVRLEAIISQTVIEQLRNLPHAA